ncbi:MAG: phosphatidate cytidylyltransferase [Bacteriovoracaceae bacterium]|nr:phosphatidate cytidylyltransferase [Bacteriovoracaceae bacterium]
MSNTQLRVISAIGLLLILVAAFVLGREASLILIGIVGVLVLDEFVCNFLEFSRRHVSYVIAQVSFVLGFAYFNFFEVGDLFFKSFNNAGIVLDVVMLLFLFMSKSDSKVLKRSLKGLTFLMGVLFLIPFLNLTALAHFEAWRALFTGLIVLNFSVDTGAWFFGRMFGSKKLWPSVSPKKTVEGFLGGVLCSVILSGIFWMTTFNTISFQLVVAFLIIACCAQLGDLVQSKMKRQFNIKDSSNLIPGHGGMYDRVDSLLFVAPLFLFVIRNLR